MKLTKDSVGKFFLDGNNYKIKITHYCDKTKCVIGKFEYYTGNTYSEDGICAFSDDDKHNLVSEYTPPRTDKEIVADLLSIIISCYNHLEELDEIEGGDPKVIQEAKERFEL